jgi:hypothetical protein
MAIIRIQRPEGVTLDRYRAVQERLNLGDDAPAGLIMHTAGEVDGQLQIIDVWESQEEADRFGNERLLPAIKSVMGEQTPTVPPRGTVIYELANLIRA